MWRAQMNSGKEAMADEQVKLLMEIIVPFCKYLVDKKFIEFEISRLENWIKIKRSDIIPYTSDSKTPEDTSGKKIEKVLDVQFACYHLSRAKSFLIICEKCNKLIDPFDHVAKSTYQL